MIHQLSIKDCKLLKIANENNKFSCDGFIHIDKAPVINYSPQFFDTVYQLEHEEELMYCQLVSCHKIKLKNICNYHTVPATGKLAYFWGKDYIKDHPDSSIETEVAIYSFKKITPNIT